MEKSKKLQETRIITEWQSGKGVLRLFTDPQFKNGYFVLEYPNLENPKKNYTRKYVTPSRLMKKIADRKLVGYYNRHMKVTFTPFSYLHRDSLKVDLSKVFKPVYVYMDDELGVMFSDKKPPKERKVSWAKAVKQRKDGTTVVININIDGSTREINWE